MAGWQKQGRGRIRAGLRQQEQFGREGEAYYDDELRTADCASSVDTLGYVHENCRDVVAHRRL